MNRKKFKPKPKGIRPRDPIMDYVGLSEPLPRLDNSHNDKIFASLVKGSSPVEEFLKSSFFLFFLVAPFF